MKKVLGKKIAAQCLRSMKSKLLFCSLLPFALFAKGLTVEDLNLKIDDCKESIRQQTHEVDLFHQRLTGLENQMTKFKKEITTRLAQPQKDLAMQKTLEQLQKSYQDLTVDLDSIKNHFNKVSQTVDQKLQNIDQQISEELDVIKKSLKTILTACDDSMITYVVKDGDSLSKIASQNKTSVNKIKELNTLKSNTIFKGQKLKLPAS